MMRVSACGLGVLAAAFDGLDKSLLDGLVQALSLGPGHSLGVGGELIVQTHGEILRHGVVVSRHQRCPEPCPELSNSETIGCD
jgi:hypothetical protein